MNSDIGLLQLKILDKAKAYIGKNQIDKEIDGASVLLYLNSWDPSSLGNVYLKTMINKWKYFFSFIISKVRNIIAIRNYSVLQLHAKALQKPGVTYDAIVVSWCKKTDFDDDTGQYIDRYFKVSSKETENILWFLVSIDGKVPPIFDTNVVIYARDQRSVYHGFVFLGKSIYKALLEHRFNLKRVCFSLSVESVFAKLITEKIKALQIQYSFKKIVQPYEAQPFQHAVFSGMKDLADKVTTIGYLHSVLPMLPTDLIWRYGAPDILYVHGEKQIEIMQKHLNWQRSDIRFLESIRYRTNIDESFSGWVFLPYEFAHINIILENLDIYLHSVKDASLPQLSARCHPAKMQSKKHVALMKGIDRLLLKHKNRFDGACVQKISVFVGSTAAIIEALERDVNVVHITADPIFETHQMEIWDAIKVQSINRHTYTYELMKKGAYIKMGTSNRPFFEMIYK
jgi:hypothetical protein